MPTTHLISGLPCSGKTAYAVELRAETNGVLFTLDRWLITAFGRYSIAEIGHIEHGRRLLVCRELIWEVATEFLRRSVDVILDDGFFLREHRIHYIQSSHNIGAAAKIHYIDTPPAVIKARLTERNANLPPQNFHVDSDALEFFSSFFEIPSENEGAELVVARNSGRS